MLPVVLGIAPKSFRWKSGGFDTVHTERLELVQETEEIEERHPAYELRDGVATMTWRTVRRSVPLYDEMPIFDEQGAPVMVSFPGQSPAYGEDGTLVRPAEPTSERQLTRPMPRMVEKFVMRPSVVERPGRRTHFGFMAPDIKAAFDEIGVDFGGYVTDGEGNEGLRPDQQIAVLWKAVQELAAMVRGLDQRIG
jgi:hypothetical protein